MYPSPVRFFFMNGADSNGSKSSVRRFFGVVGGMVAVKVSDMRNHWIIFPVFFCVLVFTAGCASFEGSDHPPGEDAGAVDQVLDGAEGADPLAAEIDLSNEAAEDSVDAPFAVDGVEEEREQQSVSGF